MNPRVLALKDPEQLADELKKIGVDEGGVPYMRPKGFSHIVKVHGIPSFTANILKQEMLSLGADAAVSRQAITGRRRRTDCLLLATLAQFDRLFSKLRRQPLGLKALGDEIQKSLRHFTRGASLCSFGKKRFRFGRKTYLMGILNLTPDSFSGDGLWGFGSGRIEDAARQMVESGADILDVGAESTRPGAKKISIKEEIKRLRPVFKILKKNISVPISIDTTKSEVAHAALDAGVSIVNDISSLRFDSKMARLVSRYKAGLVLMHMKGTPRSMQNDPRYDDTMEEIFLFLSTALKKALDAGVDEDKIILDPGIGFGKRLKDNCEILRRLYELKSLGRPILVGVSRKRFLGEVLNAGVTQRGWGTAAAVGAAIANGADIVRVHDIKEMKQIIAVSDAIHRKRS